MIILNKLREKFLSLLRVIFKLNNHTKKIVCMQISNQGFSLILVKVDPVLQVLECQCFQGDLNAQQKALSLFVEEHGLQQADCYLVLSLEDYQLMLIDKPQVAENEIGESVRWLVKDLIDFPIEEAIIDYFPAPTRSGQPAKVYVVTTHLRWLDTLAKMIATAGMTLQKIDIAALAIRNVLGSLAVIGNSAVFLMYTGKQYYILVIKDKLIYLERKLNFGLKGNINVEYLGKELVAELQRSIDFYQNRDSTIPVKIFIDPNLGQNTTLIEFIEKSLNLQMEVLDISKWLNGDQKISQLSDKTNCISIIGEALELQNR